MKTKNLVYGMVLALVASLVIVTPAKIYAQSITVNVDKAKYTTGDTVKVTGKVSSIQPGLAITIQVINAKNARFDLAQIMQNEIAADGSFSYEFKLTGSEARLPSGTWTVKVAYGEATAETTFEFESAPQELFVTIDGKRYKINATLTNGSINKVTAEPNTLTLTFDVVMNNDGEFTITLSRTFMDALSEGCSGNDDVFVIMLDDQTEFPEESKADGTRTLTVSVPVGTTEITVIGTCMVPEFGVIAALVLAASIGAIIVASRRNIINLHF